MADSNIPDLPALGGTPADDDVLEVYDTSAAVNKKVRYDELGITAGGITVYRKAFAFDDVGLTDGVEIYTPTVGEWLLNAWFQITTDWDGTQPRGDIGQFTAGDMSGFFNLLDNPQPLNVASLETPSESGGSSGTPGTTSFGDFIALAGYAGYKRPEREFLTTDPLEVIVTQDGLPGGADPGASQGAGYVYLVIATPVDL